MILMALGRYRGYVEKTISEVVTTDGPVVIDMVPPDRVKQG